MNLFYQREEKDREVVITFKYQALWYIVLLAIFCLAIPNGGRSAWQQYLVPVLFVILFAWVIGRRAANKEIRQAMRAGNVAISGSRFSFKNPITFRIKK